MTTWRNNLEAGGRTERARSPAAASPLRWSAAGWALLAACAIVVESPAQPPARPPLQDVRRRRFVQRIANVRPPGVHQRNHRLIKEAFRQVVAQPSRSVVRVLSQGRRVALGAVVAAEGWVLTKASELDGELECQHGERRWPARLAAVDEATDLALLRVDAKFPASVRWRSDPPAVGSWLATVGDGRDAVSIGVLSVAARLIPARTAVLGVFLLDDQAGPIVKRLQKNSGAEVAGLAIDDVILQVNGQPIQTSEQVTAIVSKGRPGDRVKLTIRRQDQQRELTATLGDAELMSPQTSNQSLRNLTGPLSNRRADFPAAVQHDSVLRPHQCGGPLVDLDGQAVGLNIARAGRVASYALTTPVVVAAIKRMRQRAALAADTP